MQLFDGYAFANRRAEQLTQRLHEHAVAGHDQLKIVSIFFVEDAGSQLYTRFKSEMANRVGILYEPIQHSLKESIPIIQESIHRANQDPIVTGVMVQKPSKQRWQAVMGETAAMRFDDWWLSLVQELDAQKDVDGLHPNTLAAIQAGNWRQKGFVLPATVKAVLEILGEAQALQIKKKCIVLGKSPILGKPLFYELKNLGIQAELLGSAELQKRIEEGRGLKDADIIVSATGRAGLITADLVKPSVVAVDVGEPKPDFDQAGIAKVASFLTPVPGGVGPVTVISLMENCVDIASSQFPSDLG